MGNKSSAPAAAASKNDANNDPSPSSPRPIPKHLTLLNGCNTLEDHEDCIRHVISTSRGLSGEEGLKGLGFEFRFVPCCPAHSKNSECITCVECDENGIANEKENCTAIKPPQSPVTKSASVISTISNNSDSDLNEQYANNDCHQCATRLFCVGPIILQSSLLPKESKPISDNDCQSVEESAAALKDTASHQPLSITQTETHQHEVIMITPSNRQQFIADGTMYEIIANLAQQTAHEKMCECFDLEYVTVCDEEHLGDRVRALVDRDHRLLLEEGENKWVLQELLSAASIDASSSSGNDDVIIEKEEKNDEDVVSMKKADSHDDIIRQNISLPNAQQHHSTVINKTKSTLLIATGRGKVRAGIFSRQHLLTAGIEVGTSWHCIREARMRKWGVAIIDPNARGEDVGYESFKRSMSRLFLGSNDGDGNGMTDNASSSSAQSIRQDGTTISRQSSCTSLSTTKSATTCQSQQSHSIYILAHSASGGQLVRHLREDPTLLPSIRAIAFTDSTHNVQWCKHDRTLQDFLQRKNCVYLRSNDVRSSQSCVRVSSRGKDIMCDCVTCVSNKKTAGMEADTDNFWEHRFGRIKTVWAGTADHALSNWAGHSSIWDHFDEHHDNTSAGSEDNDGSGVYKVAL
mmetsp:Transcript_15196/g.32982  ORF Transcript_15196/g.32982 Transcript_15196/m.32982 type:complete len:634 (+) Transcript_15196:37-1938(+)